MGDDRAVRVNLSQTIVQIGRLSIHFPLGSRPSGDVLHPGSHALTPLPLLRVLAIITEIDGAAAEGTESEALDHETKQQADVFLLSVAVPDCDSHHTSKAGEIVGCGA